jgi:membrane protein DedA with SNARE-associated domain
MPFAGIAGVSAARALIPMALASGVYYGVLTFLVSRLGTNIDGVLRLLRHVNSVLAIVAISLVVIIVVWIVRRRLRRPPPSPPAP